MAVGTSIRRRLGAATKPARMVSNSAASASASWKGMPGASTTECIIAMSEGPT